MKKNGQTDKILRNEDIMREEEDGWQSDSPPLIVTSRAVPIFATVVALSIWILISMIFGWRLERSIYYEKTKYKAIVISSIYDMVRVVIGIDEYYKNNHRIPNTLAECRNYIVAKADLYGSQQLRSNILLNGDTVRKCEELLFQTFPDIKTNNEYSDYDIFSLPIIYKPWEQMTPELHNIFVENNSEEYEIEMYLLVLCVSGKMDYPSDCRKMYSISTLAYDTYYPKLQKSLKRKNYYYIFQYPLSAVIVFAGVITTIKWKGKPMNKKSYLLVILSSFIPFSAIGGIGRPSLCYGTGRLPLTIFPYIERIRLLDSAVQSGEISTESADMARKFIKTLQDSGIR